MRPEAPDIVSLAHAGNLSPRVSSLCAIGLRIGAREQRTGFALSPPSPVVRIFVLRGGGFLRARHPHDAASCDAPPDKHLRCVRSMSASQTYSTTSTRTRWFPVRSLGLTPEAARRVLGTRHLAGEGGRSRHPLILASACRIHPCGVLRTRGTCSFPRDRCGQPLTRLSLLPLRLLVGFAPRLRVGPPGLELPRTALRRHVTDDRRGRSGRAFHR